MTCEKTKDLFFFFKKPSIESLKVPLEDRETAVSLFLKNTETVSGRLSLYLTHVVEPLATGV